MSKRSVSSVIAIAVTAAVSALALGSSDAPGKPKTMRIYEKARVVQLTQADGRVRDKLPLPEPKQGDVVDVVFDLFEGDHRKHGRRRIGTDHVRCSFEAPGPPDCISHANIASSQLIVAGTPPRVVLGTGDFIGAKGRVISAKEVKGVPPSNIRHNDIDVVLQLDTRR